MPTSSTLSENVDGTLIAGTRLGKYQIVRLLGVGGMGAVYEAVHSEIGKAVAVKVLNRAIVASAGARERPVREAQLASRVLHPNIVEINDVVSEGEHTFLVMELLRGEDLAQRIGRAGPLHSRDAADMMLPVCSAIVAAHQAGVTHRDLKPSNIFLSQSQHGIEPKVLDFGISKSSDGSGSSLIRTGTGAVAGTPFYLAPEQVVDNRAAGPASDQYSLGVILYESLTGIRPFQGESLYVVFNDIVTGSFVPPRSHRPDIPSAIEEVVLRAMNVDPNARYESTHALGRALLPFASTRIRSIWEDAFVGSDEAVAIPIEVELGDGRSSRAVAATRILTPSAGVTPAGPVGLAGGTQIFRSPPSSSGAPSGSASQRAPSHASGAHLSGSHPAAVASRPRPPQRFVLDDGIEPDDGEDLFAPQIRPSRAPWAVAIVGAIVVAGVVGWLTFGDSFTGASRTDKKTRRSGTHADPIAEESEPQAAITPPKSPPAPDTFHLSVSIEPTSALIELDGRSVGRGRLDRVLPLDHAPHQLRLAAEGYETKTITFTDTPPPPRISLDPSVEGQRPPRPSPGYRASSRHRGNKLKGRTNDASPQAEPPRPRGLNPNGAPIID